MGEKLSIKKIIIMVHFPKKKKKLNTFDLSAVLFVIIVITYNYPRPPKCWPIREHLHMQNNLIDSWLWTELNLGPDLDMCYMLD